LDNLGVCEHAFLIHIAQKHTSVSVCTALLRTSAIFQLSLIETEQLTKMKVEKRRERKKNITPEKASKPFAIVP
jgi:hypothetical protein